ncbi:hypothetical protein OGAPHI_006292 [Ogataea philodendri]|uniref:LST4 longin domain-containing protein n=1 Tax=Ogataea philodendri TaxID=1378263 RepID=A0A9P8NZH3_9ASCO|nr:uncharacterized protein OGAPHI_006292 [Ogataea philodendri]KAH3662111.1 hypothetical protein OGAPHI_006292 [Ogataea philodendri]
MLGNLLRKKDALSQDSVSDPQIPPPVYSTANDTHYSGSQLYGPGNNVPTANFRLSDKSSLCRLVLVQDSGIRSKQVLFDSALSVRPGVADTNPPMFLNKSFHHSVSELSALMYGYYGILLNDTVSTTKLHHLPPLSAMPGSMLITRLFSLDSSFEMCHNDQSDPDWSPLPCVYTEDVPVKDMTTTRLAFGLVIPIGRSSNAHEIITDHWPQISGHLETVQKIIISRLKAIHSLQQPQDSVKLSFPTGCLQKEPDLVHCLHQFVRSLIYLIETPRLYIPLRHSDYTLSNWANTVATWLELKDGRHPTVTTSSSPTSPMQPNPSMVGFKFLATLLTFVLPYRKEIVSWPSSDNKTGIRVVLVTGNPVISQKLILIIAGILGYDEYLAPQNLSKSVSETSEVPQPATASKPIPIRNRSFQEDSSSASTSPEITSSGSTKGWEIPTKATPIISGSPKFMEIARPERPPMSQIHRTSSYASLQNLSTSYGSQSTTVSSSWRNRFYFGSFMERWRGGSENPELTHSPAAEYEEYPWKPLSSSHKVSKLSRSLASLDMGNEKPVSRNTRQIYGSDAHVKTVKAIMSSTVEAESPEEKVLDVALNPQQSIKPTLLPMMTGFIDQYRREFSLQSCPTNFNLEEQIAMSMKDDCLKMGPGSCCKTFVINLKQREIRLVETKYQLNEDCDQAQYPRPLVTKLFSPYKRDLPEKFSQKVERCDTILNKIAYLVKDRNQNDQIRSLIKSLIN